MKKRMNGLVKAAASASLVGGAILATAGPAAAASPNSSDGASASGTLINIAPIAQATYPGTSPVGVLNATVGGLTLGAINDTADATSASSTIASTTGGLGGLLTLNSGTITSSCSFNTNTGLPTGTATITNATATALGLVGVNLNANPGPNTTVLGLGAIASITLNQQSTAGDGTLTVNAIHITLLGSGQTVDIGTSVCNAADLAAVPVLPGKALPIGLGALGVLGLGGVGFVAARRRRAGTAAA
jgi:hypothetical protein